MYGYKVNEKTIIAPNIFLIFGKIITSLPRLKAALKISFMVP
jgi:hypothetical protein